MGPKVYFFGLFLENSKKIVLLEIVLFDWNEFYAIIEKIKNFQ